MTWRSNKSQPESFEIIENVIERMDLEFAPIAGTGVHFPDGERSTKALSSDAVDSSAELGENGIICGRRRFGQRTVEQTLEEHPTHGQIR